MSGMLVTASSILEGHASEAARKMEDHKEATLALLEAYPDVKAWLADFKQAGFTVRARDIQWATTGPIHDKRTWHALPADYLDRSKEERSGAITTLSTGKSSRGTGATGGNRRKRT